MEFVEQIRAFVADRFLFDPGARIDPAQSLMKSGILDSTGAMELVLFLESTYDLKVADAELVPQNLDSIQSIAAFVARKRSVGGIPESAGGNGHAGAPIRGGKAKP